MPTGANRYFIGPSPFRRRFYKLGEIWVLWKNGGQSKELRIMSSHVHIALYDALREAGASEEKARAAAGAIPAGEHLATNQDIAELKVSFYRQLWIMAAGIVTVNAGMLTAAVMLSKLFPR